MPINNMDYDNAVKKALQILYDIQSIKNTTTVRIMGYILVKILKSKFQGLYVNEPKLFMVIYIYLILNF